MGIFIFRSSFNQAVAQNYGRLKLAYGEGTIKLLLDLLRIVGIEGQAQSAHFIRPPGIVSGLANADSLVQQLGVGRESLLIRVKIFQSKLVVACCLRRLSVRNANS